MTATAAQIAELRRRVNEPGAATYTDALLAEYIERYPLIDERGEVPYTWDTSTSPPTREDNDDWLASYDLNSAAADCWDEKAAKIAEDFDFRSEGREFSRSQAYQHAEKRAMYFRARRAMKTITARMEPPVTQVSALIGNMAEQD